jgi:hypothetical protein
MIVRVTISTLLAMIILTIIVMVIDNNASNYHDCIYIYTYVYDIIYTYIHYVKRAKSTQLQD